MGNGYARSAPLRGHSLKGRVSEASCRIFEIQTLLDRHSTDILAFADEFNLTVAG
jgi:hypothetical protein